MPLHELSSAKRLEAHSREIDRLAPLSSRIAGEVRVMMAVAQEHALGCAVACVAARVGISYSEAMVLFNEPSNSWLRGFYCFEVVEALSRAGRAYEFSPFSISEHLCWLDVEGTIVFVGRSERFPLGHYLVRSSEGWMNPWVNYPWMLQVKAGFQATLPGDPEYVIYESS